MNENELINTTPILPPPIPAGELLPLGKDPAECQPINGVVGAVEALLRQPRRVLFQLSQKNPSKLTFSLILITLFCSVVYGLVVGTFSGGTQLWAAPIKIAVGLLISGFICLPSLYIFSCLVGSQARLSEVCGILAGLLALMTILLVGFAPVAWVFSQSSESLVGMGALYLVFWLIATHFGLRFFWTGFKHLKAGGSALAVWTAIFILVALQMTTALRPIIGTAPTLMPTEKKFLPRIGWNALINRRKHNVKTVMNKRESILRRRIRWLTWFFIVSLVASGATAIPLETELNLLAGFMDDNSTSALAQWIFKVRDGLHTTNVQFPFMSYGTDWLAFGHFVIAVAFIGPLRDPVRNIWVYAFGMIACMLILPYAFLVGEVRGIPFYWRLIDCSFGVVGIIPLWICWRAALELESGGRKAPA